MRSSGVLAVTAIGGSLPDCFPWPVSPVGQLYDTSIRQVRDLRYRVIADDLRRRLADGEFAAGRMLPSEAELAAAYDASRVTVRKALDGLRSDGLVEPHRGLGWVPVLEPLRQSLARLGTIEGQLAEAGVTAER